MAGERAVVRRILPDRPRCGEVVGRRRHARSRTTTERSCNCLPSLATSLNERQAADFRAGQQHVLEMIATGASLDVVLTRLVQLVERHSDGMWCSVILLDEDGVHLRRGAAPSLPEGYNQAIEGAAIGPRAGSCGTAMYFGRTVICHRRARRSSLGGLSRAGRRLWLPRLLVDADPLGAEAGARLVCDVLPGTEAAARRGSADGRSRRQHRRHRHRAPPDAGSAAPERRAQSRHPARDTGLDVHPGAPMACSSTTTPRIPPTSCSHRDVFLGKTIWDVLPPVISNPLSTAMAGALASDEPQKFEYSLESDQTQHFYEACVVRCDGNKILSIVRDISDRKRAEMDAAIQRRELAHLSRVATLGELSGALAHELSQPMSAILINAQAATATVVAGSGGSDRGARGPRRHHRQRQTRRCGHRAASNAAQEGPRRRSRRSI